MTKPLPDTLRVGPIRSADEARKSIKDLHEANLSFHFDDSPETIYDYSNFSNPLRLFLDEDVPLVRARVTELFDFDFDPFEYALALMGHIMED